MAERSSSSPAMAFILEYLQKNGDTEYSIVKQAADKDGHTIYPIMYGRAKTLLGLITEESRSRRRRRKVEETEPGADGAPRVLRQGRPNLSEGTAQQLSSFLERFRELEGERNKYRAALLQIEKMLKTTIDEISANA